LALVVAGELLVQHLPADRMARVDRGEGVPKPGRAPAEPPESTQLLAPIWMLEAEPVARRLRDGASERLPVGLGDALDQPEPASELDHLARCERLLGRVVVDSLIPSGAPRHQF